MNANAVNESTDTSETTRKRANLLGVAPYGTVVALVVLFAVFAVVKPSEFLASDNLLAILSQGSLLAIVAGGLTLCLISFDFDLSIGAMVSLGGLTVALLLQEGVPASAAVGMVLLLGLMVGLVNGLVVVRLGVSAFIGTLGMLSILEGLGLWWAGGSAVPVLDANFASWATSKFAGLQLTVIIAVIWYSVLWVVLERTTWGRYLYAVGANQEAARLSGLRVRSTRVAAFMVCAGAAAATGILLTSQLSGAYQGAGDSYLLDAFAAVFLGAVTFRLGQFHIFGTAIGILLLAVLTNGLNIVGLPAYLVSILKGVVLIGAVSLAGLGGTLKGALAGR
jgi:ribose transport system permease protein